MYAETLVNAAALAFEHVSLPSLNDVDTWQDVLSVAKYLPSLDAYIKDNQLFTPCLSLSGVNGIMRTKIIEHWAKIDKTVHIGRFKLGQLLDADECFFCNSVYGLGGGEYPKFYRFIF